MERVRENIFHWEGPIERTEAEARVATERAEADMNDWIANDPEIQAMLSAGKKQQDAKLKAKSTLAEA